jgi:hypothetical protein
MGRGGVEAAGRDLLEFLAVVGDPAAGAAQREGWADDGGQAMSCAISLFGLSRPILVIASRKSWRFSAFSMASCLAPISSTPYLASVPSSASANAVLSAVWPPIVGSSASGRSLAMILATKSGVIGSI